MFIEDLAMEGDTTLKIDARTVKILFTHLDSKERIQSSRARCFEVVVASKLWSSLFLQSITLEIL